MDDKKQMAWLPGTRQITPTHEEIMEMKNIPDYKKLQIIHRSVSEANAAIYRIMRATA